MQASPKGDATCHPPDLVRAVSRWQLVGLAINDVVGSGIYLLPAAAAALLGGASVWAVVLAGCAAGLLVLCFAEASSYFDQPGGAYLYAREAFGHFVGFEVGWMTWLSRLAALASMAAGLVQAMTFFWPAAAGRWDRGAIVCGLILPLTAINVRGVGAGARTAVVLVIAKMLPLAFFVGAGAWFIDGSRLVVLHAPPAGALGQAALLLLFAYGGFENTPVAAGEYRNPQRNVPFALLAMIIVVTLLYGTVQLVALGTLPGLARSASPLADAALRFAGRPGAWLLTMGVVLSIAGIAGNTMLTGPRYLYALAGDGYGPQWLAHVHPRYRTPAVAIVLQAVLALALAMSGSFVQLASLSVIARVATYMSTAAAVPILRRRMADRASLRLPGGATIPVAALLVATALLGSATRTGLLAVAGALAGGALIYAGRRPRAQEAVADGERSSR
jgi:basic amino acid/polyamine antiporter, APA family